MYKTYDKAEVAFKKLKEIGQEGKNSRVYIVHDHHLDAELVIKEIKKSDLDAAEYFKESQILYLSSHPNVVQVNYACEDADCIYIAIPYYRNGSLNALMGPRYLTVREIIVYACQFISGLHNIHSKGLIHFDIKPDNILIGDTGEGLISDFGLAKHTNLAGMAGQDRMYLKQQPPEAYDGDHFTCAFDIYQVGITLYRMCNGNKMFYEQLAKYGNPATFDRDGFKFDVKNGRFPDRKSFLHHIPEKLRKIVRKCLEVNPDNRYRSVIDVSNALAEIDGEGLDWQFTEEPGKLKWEKDVGGKKYKLEIDGNGNATAKKTSTSNNETRIRDYCINSISESKIKEFLKGY